MTSLSTSYDDLPDELRRQHRWVCWRHETRDGKPTKVPYQPYHDARASATKFNTWTTFEIACRHVKKYEGLGFMFVSKDGFVGIDLDHCVENGDLLPWAKEIVTDLDSYTEYSPSGTGVHIFVKGTLPEGRRRRKDGVEMYSEGRYFTVTGNRVPGTPDTIAERTEELARLYTHLFGTPKLPQPAKPVTQGAFSLDDAALLDRARSAANGAKFSALFDQGDTSAYDGDESRADLALCGLLLFWTQGDAARTERLFSQSALGQRDKWRERADYRERTIRNALAGKSDFYQPQATAQRPQRRATSKPTAPPGARATSPILLSQLQEEGDLNQRLASVKQTDLGNAERLVARYGHRLRYCAVWGKWLVWDGTRWKPDETGQAMEYAKQTARSIFREAAETEDEAQRAALAKWAHKSESRDRLQAMLCLAQSAPQIAVHPDAFDRNGWLLNVENGTLDLHTGQLHTHRQEDYITKLAPVEYDPDAAAPQWEAFLKRVLPDEQVRAYVQRAAGYGCTADVSAQCLFFLYGSGANGKSTFLNALLGVLGDYAKQAAPDLLVAKEGSHPTELADLRGARFVATIEVEDGKRMAEGLVKQMTGGDRIRARFMRQDFFEFSPTHKLFFAANHKPIIRGTDHAIWRRIKMIPFTETIGEEEKDPRLPDKLRSEASGILNWLLAGCLSYQRDGLPEPEAVLAATGDYRNDMDTLGQFLAERCVIHPNVSAMATALYRAYEQWCDSSGERAQSQRRFGTALGERGFQRKRGSTGAYVWHGIGLRADGDDPLDTTPSEPLPSDFGGGEAFSDTEVGAFWGASEPFCTRDEKGTEPLIGFPVLTQENLLVKSVIPEKGSEGSEGSVLEFVATSALRSCAEKLAAQRTQGHDHCRKPHEDLGAKKNSRCDLFGLLAELVLTDALEKADLRPEGYQFVASRPPTKPDFTLSGVRYDVKAVLPGQHSVNINQAKHQNPETRPDFYAVCLFTVPDRFAVAIVPAADVDGWEARRGHSPYYAAPRENLQPITSLNAFTRKEEADAPRRVWK
jgi:putative DNA primase/helicase